MTSHITYTLYIRTSPGNRETRLDLGQDEPVTLAQARDLAIGRSAHAIEALRPYYVAVYRDDLAYPIAVYQNGALLEDDALENTTLRCRTCKDTGTVQTVESDGEAAYEEACPACDMPGIAQVTISSPSAPDTTFTVTLTVADLIERVLSRNDAADALDYIISIHEGGPSCGCGADHWSCTFEDEEDEEDEKNAAVGEPVSYEFDILTADQADGPWCSIQPSDPPFFAREAITAAELANRVMDQHVADTADGDEFHVRVVVWAAGEHPDGEQLAVAETHHKAVTET